MIQSIKMLFKNIGTFRFVAFFGLSYFSFCGIFWVFVLFVLSNNSKTKPTITPLEVKSSKNYTTVSLLKFKEKFRQRIVDCYILHPKNLFVRPDGMVALPCYMAWPL